MGPGPSVAEGDGTGEQGRKALLDDAPDDATARSRNGPNRRLRRVFNLSGSELVVILLLALVVLGPDKLPDALRRAGRTYAELKKMGSNFQTEMRSALDEPMKEMRETADLLKKSAQFDADAAEAAAASDPTGSAMRHRPDPVDGDKQNEGGG